jgi:hypothetical protein
MNFLLFLGFVASVLAVPNPDGKMLREIFFLRLREKVKRRH